MNKEPILPNTVEPNKTSRVIIGGHNGKLVTALFTRVVYVKFVGSAAQEKWVLSNLLLGDEVIATRGEVSEKNLLIQHIISESLKRVARFNGAVFHPVMYKCATLPVPDSVYHHCVRVANEACTKEGGIADYAKVFFHDAEEGVLTDIQRPVLAMLGVQVEELYDDTRKTLYKMMGIDYPTEEEWVIINKYDKEDGDARFEELKSFLENNS